MHLFCLWKCNQARHEKQKRLPGRRLTGFPCLRHFLCLHSATQAASAEAKTDHLRDIGFFSSFLLTSRWQLCPFLNGEPSSSSDAAPSTPTGCAARPGGDLLPSQPPPHSPRQRSTAMGECLSAVPSTPTHRLPFALHWRWRESVRLRGGAWER